MVHALHASYSFRCDRLYKRRMSQDCLPLYLPSFNTKNTKKSHNNRYTTKDDLDHVSTFLIETASTVTFQHLVTWPLQIICGKGRRQIFGLGPMSSKLQVHRSPNTPMIQLLNSSLITSSPKPSTPKSRYVVCISFASKSQDTKK